MGHRSDFFGITSGVPQDLILGLYFFIEILSINIRNHSIAVVISNILEMNTFELNRSIGEVVQYYEQSQPMKLQTRSFLIPMYILELEPPHKNLNQQSVSKVSYFYLKVQYYNQMTVHIT